MKRTLISCCLASLLAIAVVAPAAGGATQIRHFEAFGATPPAGPYTGDLGLEVVFKNKRSTPRKFTPRLVRAIRFQNVPLSCHAPMDPGTESALLSTTLQARIKLKKVPPPGGGKPKPGRYSFRFSHSFTGFAGKITGTIDKANGRGTPRSHGSFEIDRIDFPPPGPDYCATSGVTGWSAAGGCRLAGAAGSLPVCRLG